MMPVPALCLASASPRRRDLLASIGVTVEVTEDEIAAYWATGEPVDKAGGYAIQGLAAVFVASVGGSHSAVVGLPLFETAALLARQGVPVWSRAMP